jgi:hypothetical protein
MHPLVGLEVECAESGEITIYSDQVVIEEFVEKLKIR